MSKTDLIYWLDDISLAQRDQAGGKAAVLGALRKQGVPVPNGFCIHYTHLPIDSQQDWQDISSAYQRLTADNSVVAVRSTGVDEDSKQASFAGQYDSVLNVANEAMLKEAIQQVGQSANSLRAQNYSQNHQKNGQGLSVLVQSQIEAEFSGVLFTADPITAQADRIFIEAIAGLGEALVSGHKTPVQYQLNRQGELISSPAQTLLSPEMLKQLLSHALNIESILGAGQDIEWAIADNKIYILQARPITATTGNIPLSQIWTRANIGEVLPNVVTSLTWSVFQATLTNNAQAVLQASPENSPSDGIKLVQGKAFLRLDALLNSFCYLPTVNPAIMQEVLGVNVPPTAEQFSPPSTLPVKLAQGLFWGDLFGMLPRLSYIVKHFPDLPPAKPEQLLKVINWTTRCFALHLKCTAYAIAAYGAIAQFLSRNLSKEDNQYLVDILIGHEDLQSAVQGTSLWQLALEIYAQPQILEIFQADLTWSDILKRLQNSSLGQEILEKLQAFLNLNGARAVGEFELSVPRWREDPGFVLLIIKKYLNALQAEGSLDMLTQRRIQRQERIAKIEAALNGRQQWIFKRMLKSYQDYATYRENIKYHLIEGFSALRTIFLTMGDSLQSKKIIKTADDIFFLKAHEAWTLYTTINIALQPRQLILERKAEHSAWQAYKVPDMLVGNGHTMSSYSSDELTGIGCSPGMVEGVARVLSDLSQAKLLKPGEILVTAHTDPGWTPLFLSARAVVTEIGGFLSHGATVAREYGIPAIVNVRGATTKIKTGDVICVDGLSGRITLVK